MSEDFQDNIIFVSTYGDEPSLAEQLQQYLPFPQVQRTVLCVGGHPFFDGRKFDLPQEGWDKGRMQFRHQDGITVYEYVRVGRDNAGWQFVDGTKTYRPLIQLAKHLETDQGQ